MNPQGEVTEFQQKQQNAIYEFLRVCTDIWLPKFEVTEFTSKLPDFTAILPDFVA